MGETENEKFNRLSKELKLAEAKLNSIKEERERFIRDNYKYWLSFSEYGLTDEELDKKYKCEHFKNLKIKLDCEEFGEHYCKIDGSNCIKDFRIVDIDFTKFENCKFRLINEDSNFTVFVLSGGDVQISNGQNGYSNLSKEEYEKLISHDKRDELFQLIINGDDELALMLLNNK